MAIYYWRNEEAKEAAHMRDQNHWFCYLSELLTRLGVTGEPIGEALNGDRILGEDDVLFLDSGELPEELLPILTQGVDRGLTLIGFATRGVDRLFGIRSTDRVIPQPEGPFSQTGYFQLVGEGREWLPPPERDAALPVFAEVVTATARDSRIGGVVVCGGEEWPAFFQCGQAVYFAFDVTQTLWVGTQGKPVLGGSEQFPVGRVPDGRAVSLDYDTRTAFGDDYMLLFQSILAGKGYPMLHRLPPLPDGTIPDLLLYYGGDDDATDAVSVDLRASDIMAELGLPYHLNLMQGPDGEFLLSTEQFEQMEARGQTLALHYDLTAGLDAFSQENFGVQIKRYRHTYGQTPVVNVGHCLVNRGWAEHARYQAAYGIRGDNSRLAEIDPADINAFNLYGFGFGTAFPFFVYEDGAHGNVRLPFVDLPITYYEPRIGEAYPTGRAQLHACLDSAVYFGRTINLFLHPHYLAGYEGYDSRMTQEALRDMLSYCACKGYRPYHCTPDDVCLWWHDRAASQLSAPQWRDGDMTFTLQVQGARGVIVKLPVGRIGRGDRVLLDGQNACATEREIDGRLWRLLPVRGEGSHRITVRAAE